jgi:fatty acid desaturase
VGGWHGALAVAKILENMEIGHNVLHGQWDWMGDPEIHSTTWEWDSASVAEGWKYSHNHMVGGAQGARRAVAQGPGPAGQGHVAFPLLSGLAAPTALLGNLVANLTRNVWAHAVIFCGHFPAGAETFTEDQLDGETPGRWYVRQLLGTANIDGPR